MTNDNEISSVATAICYLSFYGTKNGHHKKCQIVVVMEILATFLICLEQLCLCGRQEEDMSVSEKLYLNPSLQGADVGPLVAAAVQMPEEKTEV